MKISRNNKLDEKKYINLNKIVKNFFFIVLLLIIQSCNPYDINKIVDKTDLLGSDYRLFQNIDNCFGDCEEEYKKNKKGFTTFIHYRQSLDFVMQKVTH
jgi:hypothetical protein